MISNINLKEYIYTTICITVHKKCIKNTSNLEISYNIMKTTDISKGCLLHNCYAVQLLVHIK